MPFPLLSYHSLPFLQIGNYQVKARVTRSQLFESWGFKFWKIFNGGKHFRNYIFSVKSTFDKLEMETLKNF